MTTDKDFLDGLKQLLVACENLTQVWNEHPMADFIGIEGYPKALYSFDEVTMDIRKWYLEQKKYLEGEQ